jgi:hypothetical protein
MIHIITSRPVLVLMQILHDNHYHHYIDTVVASGDLCCSSCHKLRDANSYEIQLLLLVLALLVFSVGVCCTN